VGPEPETLGRRRGELDACAEDGSTRGRERLLVSAGWLQALGSEAVGEDVVWRQERLELAESDSRRVQSCLAALTTVSIANSSVRRSVLMLRSYTPASCQSKW